VSPRATIERLLFVHLGRTGGTTLRTDVLYKRVRPEATFCVDIPEPPARYGSVNDLLALPFKEQAKLRLVLGHMPFGLRNRLPIPETWHYVTFLRDPATRIVSEYYQVRANPGNPAHPLGLQHSLEEFVRRGYGLSWNGMCRMLSNEVYGQRFESTEAMYETALRNLECCTLVGLTEFFPESVRRLCRLCAWKEPKFGRQYSLTPPSRQLSSGEASAIREHNALDYRLYDHCLRRFVRAAA
jgi:hypothetical protein